MRIEQPFGMFLQTENRRALFRLVGAQAFKHAHAVMQRVGQHMGRSIAPRHKLASYQIKPSRSDIDIMEFL